jgi:hypothetical protein
LNADVSECDRAVQVFSGGVISLWLALARLHFAKLLLSKDFPNPKSKIDRWLQNTYVRIKLK